MAARTALASPSSSTRSPLRKHGFVPSSPSQSLTSFRPARLGITSISEDGTKRLQNSRSAPSLPLFSKTLAECQGTYSSMSAKARGAKVHAGPLELKQSMPGRDCTEWVREDKQYSPYSKFDNPDNKPPPKTRKSKGPPPLWLPSRAKDSRTPKGLIGADGHDTLPLGAEAGGGEEDSVAEPIQETPPGEPLKERPQWNSEHHIMFSRMNHEVQCGSREYFDKPVRKEGEGIPKVREQYAMHDRQCGWNDEPAPLGEYRRTLYDNIGPINIGGCKEHQLPSYWRKIKDWKSYTEDDAKPSLSLSRTGRPLERQLPKDAMFKSVADLPADKAVEFWRGWAEKMSAPGTLPPKNRYDAPTGWDNRWQVCWSRANDSINQRQREYFSVPQGATGSATSPCRPRKSMAAIGRMAAATDRRQERR